jgi:hypothetical protein
MIPRRDFGDLWQPEARRRSVEEAGAGIVSRIVADSAIRPQDRASINASNGGNFHSAGIIRRVPSRYRHYYFYIRDPVIGPLAMCVGTYLPFQTTYYLNGHNFIEIELRRQGVSFRKNDNAFLATSDPKALQAAAGKLTAATIEKRLNYWSWLLCPKFSEQDRKAVNLNRKYSLNQIEYCRNLIFKRHFPIHKIFEQFCEMGLFRLAADRVAYIFGVRVTERLRGKLYSVLEKLDHGHHVLRIYCNNLVGRMYDSASPYGLWCLTYRPDHRLVGFRWRIDGLLHEPEEELAAALGLPAVEAKGEFIQIECRPLSSTKSLRRSVL